MLGNAFRYNSHVVATITTLLDKISPTLQLHYMLVVTCSAIFNKGYKAITYPPLSGKLNHISCIRERHIWISINGTTAERVYNFRFPWLLFTSVGTWRAPTKESEAESKSSASTSLKTKKA